MKLLIFKNLIKWDALEQLKKIINNSHRYGMTRRTIISKISPWSSSFSSIFFGPSAISLSSPHFTLPILIRIKADEILIHL